MIPAIIGYDAMSKNEHVLPADVMAAGYDTQAGGGTGFIAWTPEQYARHVKPYPALHIDQNPGQADFTFDYMDVETGAIPASDIPALLTEARNAFQTGQRPGQRWPGVYCSLSLVAGIVTELQNAKITNVPFIVAEYGISQADAVNRVATAQGPYPAVGYQFNDTAFGGLADTNVWSVPWIANVSIPVTEVTEMISGQLISEAFVPMPVGSHKGLKLYRDFVNAANPATVRVAVHSASKGYTSIGQVTLSEAIPYPRVFPEPDTDAVSLLLVSGSGPVGFTIS